MRTPRQILIAELDDQHFIISDFSYPKAIREAAMRRVRQLEGQLGFPPTPDYNGRPLRLSAQRRQIIADGLMVGGWIIALIGLGLMAAAVPIGLVIGVTFGGFAVALVGALVRP